MTPCAPLMAMTQALDRQNRLLQTADTRVAQGRLVEALCLVDRALEILWHPRVAELRERLAAHLPMPGAVACAAARDKGILIHL